MLMPGSKPSLRLLDLFLQRAFQLWVQPEALIEVLLRLCNVALREPRQSSISIRLGEHGINNHRRFVVRDAPTQLSFVL
jgi:hypothetical protein